MNNGYSLIKDYSVAPYNFVSLPEIAVNAYESIEELPKHNELNDLLLNGYIEYDIVTKTPLMICDNSKSNSKEFFKNSKGEKAIPGSTLRGAIADNVAILSLSNITDYIKNERFLYRIFGKGALNNDYKNRLQITTKDIGGDKVSAPFTMKAGYIYKQGKDSYAIIPAKEINGYSYFRISEQYLRKINPKVDGINYMYTSEIVELINKKEMFKNNQREKQTFLKKIANKDKKGNEVYKPYCVKISFNLKGKRNVNKIGKPGEFSNEGYLISSEKIQGKLAHYIIPIYETKDNEIVFNKENENIKYIDFYKDDCLRTKKQREPNKIGIKDKEYFLLPNNIGEKYIKPIFYGKFNNLYCFGFSPYVRIPYDNSILDGVSENFKNKKGISYLEGIFGFTNKKINEIGKEISYKGRVSFEDAVLCSKEVNKRTYKIVAGGPKASAYNLYLKQDIKASAKEIKTYNSKGFKIRGVKGYWPRDFIREFSVESNKLNISINPVSEGNIFKGKIKFKNLKKEELGLLLWALKIDKDCYETLGYGKPYGFGTVKVENINVVKDDIKIKYSSMINESEVKVNIENIVSYYKDYFKETYNIDLENHPSVKDLKIMKTTLVKEKDKNQVRYMSLNVNKDYGINEKKNKNEFNLILPLPSAVEFKEILEGRKIIKNNVYSQSKDSNNRHYLKNNYNKTYNENNNKYKNRNNSNKRKYADKETEPFNNGLSALGEFFK